MRGGRPCLLWSWFAAAVVALAPGVEAEHLIQNGSFGTEMTGWTATDASTGWFARPVRRVEAIPR